MDFIIRWEHGNELLFANDQSVNSFKFLQIKNQIFDSLIHKINWADNKSNNISYYLTHVKVEHYIAICPCENDLLSIATSRRIETSYNLYHVSVRLLAILPPSKWIHSVHVVHVVYVVKHNTWDGATETILRQKQTSLVLLSNLLW